jgi:hypothetical protein
MDVHMGEQQWGYLTNEQKCTLCPTLPHSVPTYPPNATDDVKAPLLEAFEAEMKT